MEIKNQVVFLTGAGGGLGQSLIKKFLEKGAKLILTDQTKENVLNGLKKIGISYPNKQIVDIVAIDLANQEEIISYFNRFYSDPQNHIDILVNNACLMSFGPFTEIPVQKWNKDIAVSLFAPMLIIQKVLPHMKERNYGCLCTINSLVCMSIQKYKTTYAVSKVGLKMFCDIIHEEIEDFNIKMTNIFPYFIKTPILYNVAAYGLENPKLIDDMLADEPDDIADQVTDSIIKEKYEVYAGSAERCMRYSKLHNTTKP